MLSVSKLTIFNRFLEIIAYKYGSFSSKIAEKNIVKIRFRLFQISGLSGTATIKIYFFCGFPYINNIFIFYFFIVILIVSISLAFDIVFGINGMTFEGKMRK